MTLLHFREQDSKGEKNKKQRRRAAYGRGRGESGFKSGLLDFARKNIAPYFGKTLDEDITLHFTLTRMHGTMLLNLPAPPTNRLW